MTLINFKIIDSLGDEHSIATEPMAYRSLMELIVNELLEDIGDCRGRAWCGTCIVKQIDNKNLDHSPIDKDEEILLNKFPNPQKDHIRLACQIEINQKLQDTTWQVVDSRLWM